MRAVGDGAKIEGAGIMTGAGYGNDAATPERSDAAPSEQSLEIELLSLGHTRSLLLRVGVCSTLA